jgi:Xaa-Pro dipeptidase
VTTRTSPSGHDVLRSPREAGRRRLEALRGLMDERRLDLVVAYGSGQHHFIGANACWYLSGLRQMGRDAALAVPLEGEPVLVLTPVWDGARARRRGWIDDVVAAEALLPALSRELEARGWSDGRRAGFVGLARAAGDVAAALRGVLGGATDADELFLRLTHTRDELGIALIEQAVAIADEGYRHLLDVARPGMREYELAAECDWKMRSLGADDNFQLISASQHGHAVRAPGTRELREGDVILGEISPSVSGQFAQICRTAVIGEPTRAQRDAYEILVEAFEVGLRALTPGNTIGAVAKAMNAFVTERGFGRYTKPPYMRSRGHAMGLTPLVPADVSEGNETVVEPGMSFVLHPNQYMGEAAYQLCGEQVVIEESGARVITDRPLALDVIDAEGRA